MDDDAGEVGKLVAEPDFEFLGDVVDFGDGSFGVYQGVEGEVDAATHALEADVLEFADTGEFLADGFQSFDIGTGVFCA